MRFTFYTIGTLFFVLGLLCLVSAFGTGNPNDAITSYGLAMGFLVGGTLLFAAAIEDYKGGFWVLAGSFILAFSIFLIWFTYGYFRSGNWVNFKISLSITLVLAVLSGLLIRVGHKRHCRLRAASQPKTIAAAEEFEPPQVGVEETINTVDHKISEHLPTALYPPTPTWRMFLLLVFSGTLYAIFLSYRILKDLYHLGEKQFSPKRDAALILVPLYGIVVFSQMANAIAKSAKQHKVSFQFKPVAMVGLLILTGLVSVYTPTFLYPLSIVFASVPWLLLHQQMNRLRLTYTTDWHQPIQRFSWPQRSVFLIGVPLMVLILIGSKKDFQYFISDQLTIGQSVSGSPLYSLTVPDQGWHKLKPGTLNPGTNLELLNKATDEWVVVHVQPRQQQTLDGLVDLRRSVVANTWKDFKVDEKRTLASSVDLVPQSIAYYSQPKPLNGLAQFIIIATTLTSESTIEVIGQGRKNHESSLPNLVKSFKLTAAEIKP